MADNSVVETIKNAEIDARSLSEFISKGASFTVSRRLAPSIHTLDYYLDKFGSIADDGSRLMEQVIKNSGFTIVGKFAGGATAGKPNDVLQDASGKLYRWAGSLPKSVPAGSTPESSGGFGANAWVEVSDAAIRQELAVEYGVSNAANSIVTVDNVAELEALPENAKREDLRYLVKGYHAGSNVGGGLFEYAPTSPSPDDGGRRIGDFVRVETTYDTPFTFANYGYDFENHTIPAQDIAQIIFSTLEALPDDYHAIIEISDGVIFTDSYATLRRPNFTLRGEGTFYVSGTSSIESTYAEEFIRILLPDGRGDNVVIKDLRMIGLFDSSLKDMYENRGFHYGRRLYVRGANGIRVSNIYAKRIAIPIDVRVSTNVQISNITLVEGNCCVSLISSKYVNISDITAIDYTGAVVDFSEVQYGSVTNIVGYVSEEGRDIAEECMDIGSSKDVVFSNIYSYGPSKNMIRIKFEDVEQPFSNLRFSNLVCRDALMGIIIQSSTNNTGELTEHIHIDGVRMITDDACIAMTGTSHVYNVSVNNFHLISKNGTPLALFKMSDINISNGYAFCEAEINTRPAIRLGDSSIRDDIFGERINVSNVRVGSTNKGKEAITVLGATDVVMSDVTITESYRNGIWFEDSRNVRLSNMNIRNIESGSGIYATFSSAKFGSEVDADFSVKSSSFVDFGKSAESSAAVYLSADGVAVTGVTITDNNAVVSSSLPVKPRRLAIFQTINGGSFTSGSIYARNTTRGIPTMTSGDISALLVKDNDAL